MEFEEKIKDKNITKVKVNYAKNLCFFIGAIFSISCGL